MEHVTTTYRSGAAAETLGLLGDYVAIADPVAWQVCGDAFPDPVARLAPASLEAAALDELRAAVPPGLPIVGVGGGLAIDAAKFCAVTADTTVTLIPTLTSSNAPFTDFITVRRDGAAVGLYAAGAPKRVIVDVELIARADPRLNRAGYADLVYLAVAIADWRAAGDVAQVPFDDQMAAQIEAVLDDADRDATLIGSVSSDGLEALMRLYERATRILGSRPAAPLAAGSEHLFAWSVEPMTERHYIHGELVGLGIVITESVSGMGSRWREALDRAQVRWRLEDIGLPWEDFLAALLHVREYNERNRNFAAILPGVDWDDTVLNLVRASVTAL
jgi:glycerol-1-phosphate dehydrogenase [NAD(P)+]